jgi:mono/diheme cytochrome c family protein
MTKIVVALAGLSLLGIFLKAQGAASLWDGVYTEGQAKRGEAAYKKDCGSCHGDDLGGSGQAPALAGNDFKMDWNGLSVGDLFDRIRVSMPADRPGKLTPEEYADILAFMLKGNQFPAGKQELPGKTEPLKQIRFETAKP